MKFLFTLLLVLISSACMLAQDIALPAPGTPEYDELKRAGQLNGLNAAQVARQEVITPVIADGKIAHPVITQSSGCQCMLPLDSTFSVVPMTGGSPPDYRNDDGSSSSIAIPFSFCFYGTNYSSIYINNNGNISFGAPYATFSSSGFPSASFSMVAPFWADVDTRGLASGLVYYKVTPTAVIVKWDAVGYYSMQTDKLNTFQLIITDGTDPLVDGGNNVSFCYGDMNWTTGSASSGINGFGGIPATVGANEGNGIDFIQFGQFDSPGQNYTGPFPVGPPYEGVDWLDYKSFVFSTCTGSNNNVAPIASGITACDTLKICNFNDTLVINSFFLSPEAGQNTTVTITAPGVSGFSVLSNTAGNTAYTSAQIIGLPSNVGFNTITFSATDNGSPAQTTTVNVVVWVDTSGASFNPVITGASAICPGGQVTLDAGAGYDSYNWSNGYSSQTITVNTPGAYWVTVEQNSCSKTVSVNVQQDSVPVPVISGQQLICNSATTPLTTTQPYQSYQWSTGSTAPTINVGPGTYTVTVIDSGSVCTGSTTFTVSGYTPTVGIQGQNIICSDTTATLTATPGFTYQWSTGATTQTVIVPPGSYTVTATDTSGCTAQAVFSVMGVGPVVSITGVQAFCPGDSIQLNATSSTAISYQWSTGENSPSIYATGGTYIVTASDISGCTEADTITVAPDPSPVAAASINPPLIGSPNAPVMFTDQSTVSTGTITSWYWIIGDTSYSVQNPTHTFTDPGTYTVTLIVETQSGCLDTLTIEYVVLGEVIPPNVFTPNGDGRNDMLVFKFLEFYSNNSLQIYNRWGNKVFEANGYRNDWKANDVSDGVYYYILTVPDLEETYRGFVEILR